MQVWSNVLVFEHCLSQEFAFFDSIVDQYNGKNVLQTVNVCLVACKKKFMKIIKFC